MNKLWTFYELKVSFFFLFKLPKGISKFYNEKKNSVPGASLYPPSIWLEDGIFFCSSPTRYLHYNPLLSCRPFLPAKNSPRDLCLLARDYRYWHYGKPSEENSLKDPVNLWAEISWSFITKLARNFEEFKTS